MVKTTSRLALSFVIFIFLSLTAFPLFFQFFKRINSHCSSQSMFFLAMLYFSSLLGEEVPRKMWKLRIPPSLDILRNGESRPNFQLQFKERVVSLLRMPNYEGFGTVVRCIPSRPHHDSDAFST
jgi:hypothetical protein